MLRICSISLCLFLFVISNGYKSFAATELVLGAGTKLGVYCPLGKAISKVIAEQSNGTLQVEARITSGSGENIQLINDKIADISFTQNVIAHHAFYAKGRYQHRVKNIRALGRLYSEYIHIIARENSGLNSISDFRGKRISVGIEGSGNERSTKKILQSYGLDYDDIIVSFYPLENAIKKFEDGSLDALFVSLGTENMAMKNLMATTDARFVPMDAAQTSNFVTRFPYFIKNIIRAGTYKGQVRDIPTLSVQALLIVHKDMPEDLAYNVTKIVFENTKDIAQAHIIANNISLINARDGITIPFHAGAERYYEEMGID